MDKHANYAVTSGTADAAAAIPEAVPIRPLSFREQLDLPFAAIQAGIRMLAPIGGIGLAIAVGAVTGITALGSVATSGSDTGTAWSAILSTLVSAWLLRLLVRTVTLPATLAAVHRRPTEWRNILPRLDRTSGRLLLAQVMSTLIGLGVLLLGTPLVITFPLAVAWLLRLRGQRFLITPVLVEESAAYPAAVRRSKLLTKGTEWRIGGLWFYLRCLFTVLIVPILGVDLFFSNFSGTHRWAVIVLSVAAVLLLAAFAELVDSATSVVSYLDRRCRREALDVRIPAAANGVRGVVR